MVVGGVIAGLATAHALIRTGHEVTVLERDAEPREVGAGISLWSNALRALDALGLLDRVRAVGGAVDVEGGVRRAHGTWLSRSSPVALERRTGVELLVLHRAELHTLLREALPDGVLLGDNPVTGVVQQEDLVTVHTRDAFDADLVVGADGLRSRVREHVWPDGPRPVYAGQWQLPVVLGTRMSHSARVITVLLRYEHHIDHSFLDATHYQDQDGVLTVHRGQDEVARFPAGSWDGVYRCARNRVREPDGRERTAKGLEVEIGDGSEAQLDLRTSRSRSSG